MKFAREWGGLGAIALGVLGMTSVPAALAAPDESEVSSQTMTKGEELYVGNCLRCHGKDGTAGTPLADNQRLSDGSYVARTILVGPGYMTPFGGILDDAEVAAISTYVRNSWGNDFGAVAKQQVAAIRKETGVAKADAGSDDLQPVAIGTTLKSEIADYSKVTAARLADPDPSDWLLLRRTYDGQGHSPLSQITTENVASLEPVWSMSTGPYRETAEFKALPARGAHQSPAIVNDGVMFMTTHDSQVIAVDAATGEEYWRFRWELPTGLVPVHPTNRGVALWQDRLFITTLDAHVVALDAKTGEQLWSTSIADWREGYYTTLAPLVVDGKVMVGPSGGEFGIRGFVQALDAETGESLWKTYTIPSPDQPGGDTWPGDTWKRGGGPTWITGNYDVENDVAYWGVGNAAPWVAALRRGDNLYTASTIGLDPATGEIETHFQYHWNGTWDWDEVVPPTLVDVDGEKLALRFARNGWIYKLNREGGDLSFVEGKPYVYQDAFTGLDPDTGRPSYNEATRGELGERVEFCPSAWGGRDWPYDAYDPASGTLFIPVNENHCGSQTGSQVSYEPGVLYLGSGLEMKPTEDAKHHIGALQAWDVRTLEKKWQVNFKSPNWGPVLHTAGGLVFSGGTNDAKFRAFDAETGEVLWSTTLDGGIVSPPTSFEVDGTQYVAVTTGWGVDADRFQGYINEAMGTDPDVPQGGTIWVFAVR